MTSRLRTRAGRPAFVGMHLERQPPNGQYAVLAQIDYSLTLVGVQWLVDGKPQPHVSYYLPEVFNLEFVNA